MGHGTFAAWFEDGEMQMRRTYRLDFSLSPFATLQRRRWPGRALPASPSTVRTQDGVSIELGALAGWPPHAHTSSL